METGSISESSFLLTELRYTLGQLHVQLADIDSSTTNEATAGIYGRIHDILGRMAEYEARYHIQYSEITHAQVPAEASGLPAEPESTFEARRGQTIALLEQVREPWPESLLELVRNHVAEDRHNTTAIAEERKALFEQDQRPDLAAPLHPTT